MLGLYQRWFGVPTTLLYDNGTTVTMRFAEFRAEWRGDRVTKIDWTLPRVAFVRRPMYFNIDHVTAIWQGHA